jgi:hypothetical protein
MLKHWRASEQEGEEREPHMAANAVGVNKSARARPLRRTQARTSSVSMALMDGEMSFCICGSSSDR